MGQILIRNVDDAVLAELKRHARSRNVSAEEEVRQMLTANFGFDRAAWLAGVEALSAKIGRLPGPTSTELLREDRDRDERR